MGEDTSSQDATHLNVKHLNVCVQGSCKVERLVSCVVYMEVCSKLLAVQRHSVDCLEGMRPAWSCRISHNHGLSQQSMLLMACGPLHDPWCLYVYIGLLKSSLAAREDVMEGMLRSDMRVKNVSYHMDRV